MSEPDPYTAMGRASAARLWQLYLVTGLPADGIAALEYLVDAGIGLHRNEQRTLQRLRTTNRAKRKSGDRGPGKDAYAMLDVVRLVHWFTHHRAPRLGVDQALDVLARDLKMTRGALRRRYYRWISKDLRVRIEPARVGAGSKPGGLLHMPAPPPSPPGARIVRKLQR
jgi:hypothetical protein